MAFCYDIGILPMDFFRFLVFLGSSFRFLGGVVNNRSFSEFVFVWIRGHAVGTDAQSTAKTVPLDYDSAIDLIGVASDGADADLQAFEQEAAYKVVKSQKGFAEPSTHDAAKRPRADIGERAKPVVGTSAKSMVKQKSIAASAAESESDDQSSSDGQAGPFIVKRSRKRSRSLKAKKIGKSKKNKRHNKSKKSS